MTGALLCETVLTSQMVDLRAARDASVADLVEVRLDGTQAPDVAGALAGRRTPVLVTCRPRWEGGLFDGSEEERRTILRQAVNLGAEFVDIEWRAGFDDLIGLAPERVVVSSHDFDGVPADMTSRVQAMRQTGAGTIKVAVATSRLSDTLPLRDIAGGGPAVVVGMGEAGVVTRLLATRFGSRWTYAGNGVAPGQIPAARMIGEYAFRRAATATRLFGVVSRTATHSLSPAMHNAAFEALGLDAVYVPLSSADFADFDAFASAFGIDGASVTIPFKIDAMRAAVRVDAQAAAVGAVNTLRRAADGWEARNTDVDGFLEPLDGAWDGSLRGARAAVLGAGGAARAVVAGLRSREVLVTVYARRASQAADVAADLGASAAPWAPPPGSWDLLVNTTPLGGPDRRDESPLPDGPFGGRLVYDLTYGDGPSRLLRDARDAGCATLDGLPMLVAQARRQFEWWTGQQPPAGVMQQAAARRRQGSSTTAAVAGVGGGDSRCR